MRLKEIGIEETKASIDSKISRGTFSASFLFQSLFVIGCSKIEIEEYEMNLQVAAEPIVEYKKAKKWRIVLLLFLLLDLLLPN